MRSFLTRPNVKQPMARFALFLVSQPRKWVTNCLETAGFGVIVAGFFRVSETCGVFAAGAALLLLGVLNG